MLFGSWRSVRAPCYVLYAFFIEEVSRGLVEIQKITSIGINAVKSAAWVWIKWFSHINFMEAIATIKIDKRASK